MYETAVVVATEKCSLGAKIPKMSLQAYDSSQIQRIESVPLHAPGPTRLQAETPQQQFQRVECLHVRMLSVTGLIAKDAKPPG